VPPVLRMVSVVMPRSLKGFIQASKMGATASFSCRCTPRIFSAAVIHVEKTDTFACSAFTVTSPASRRRRVGMSFMPGSVSMCGREPK